MKLFVDTWAWFVLADSKNVDFNETLGAYRRSLHSGGRIYTTEYVLDELITLLYLRASTERAERYITGILKSSEDNQLVIERITPTRFQKAWSLRKKYGERADISFTDFCSFAIMKEFQIERVLTGDAHFEEVNLGFTRMP